MKESLKRALILSVATFLIQPVFGMYHQKAGRFMQQDPLGYVDGMNMYVYAQSNSIRYADPYGMSSYSPPWSPYPGSGYYPGQGNSGNSDCDGLDDKLCNLAAGANALLQLKMNGIDHTNDRNGGNAFRHCLATCQASKMCGADSAKNYWNGREDGESPASNMDLENNKIGYEVTGSCWDGCGDALKSGKLTCRDESGNNLIPCPQTDLPKKNPKPKPLPPSMPWSPYPGVGPYF